MPMPCTTCKNPRRAKIDEALVTGETSLSEISQNYGLSPAALHRHKAHIPAALSVAKQAREASDATTLLVHDIAINTAFFSVFEYNGETLLTTDWLLDQEEVTQRAESKAKAPWSGLWYYNVGQDNERNWEDMRKYAFIAAGGSRYYSDFLKKLSPGDKLFAYQKQAGYVGYGIVTGQPLPCKDFVINETPILKLPLEAQHLGHDADDLDKCEYLVAVEWKKTFPLTEAKTFAGVFANQNIVCKLRDTATLEFLSRVFPKEEGQQQG